MTQKITNVVLLGHRFTVMHTSPLITVFGIDAIYIGDHPDDISQLLMNKGAFHGIVVAVAALSTPNAPDLDEDPDDLAMFSDTEARAVLELFDATEANK